MEKIRRKTRVFTPGPVEIPPFIYEDLHKIRPHRSPETKDAIQRVREKLKKLFHTSNEVLLLSSSGTGAMEAAVSNVLGPKDFVITINAGKFGKRWSDLCERYGISYEEYPIDYGQAFDISRIEELLKQYPQTTAILAQGTETSTGVKFPIEDIAKLFDRQQNRPLLIVDGITSVGVYPFPMDQFGIDVLISSSQKAFMLPPGLSFISISGRAFKKINENERVPSYYFDLKRTFQNQIKNQTSFTPSVPLIFALDKVLHYIVDEMGIDAFMKKIRLLSDCVKGAVKEMGLEQLPKFSSECCTAILTPIEIPNSDDIVRMMRDRFGYYIAGGQEGLKGKIFRIGHLGFIDHFDNFSMLTSLEMTLYSLGYKKFKRGDSIQRAQEIYHTFLGE